MHAEVQQHVGAEVLREPAVEGGEGMGRREAALEQQPHRVALVAEGGLQADEDVAELRAEHEDAAAVGLVPAGRRAPLRLDLAQVRLARDDGVGGDVGRDVRRLAELAGVAAEHRGAQGLDGLRAASTS